MEQQKELKLYPVFGGLFVATLLISNVTAQKIFSIGPFTFPGGIIVFPISYIFGDILCETYGYARTRKIIWTGFLAIILAGFIYWVVGLLPAAPFGADQESYSKILGMVPRIVTATILGYFLGEFSNSMILSKMKRRASGRRGISQGMRFVVSTIVGEGVDTVIFITVAFGGIFPSNQLVWMGISVYLFKVIYEVVVTPLTVIFSNWVKKVEGVDHIDEPEKTNYNPFSFKPKK